MTSVYARLYILLPVVNKSYNYTLTSGHRYNERRINQTMKICIVDFSKINYVLL
jgi:hypothetical protein